MLPTKWPRWIVIPIGFVLVAAVTGLGLGLVMAVQAFATGVEAVPSPTPPAIAYAGHVSTACTDCHVDEAKLSESAAGEAEIQRLYIAPEDTQVLHGQLGCVTCHLGTPETEDVAAAHEGIVLDPSLDRKGDCLQCHPALPNEFPESGLIAPHAQVMDGSAQDLACSDCHGSVGHGYDPASGEVTISMMACVECHQQQRLSVQLENCDACHMETPVWNPEMDCAVCHVSDDSRSYADLLQDPNLLGYAHAQEGLACLDCHEQAALEEAHQPPLGPMTARRFDNDFCTGCHVENEHTSYEQVIARTTDYVIEGEVRNPHNPHANPENVEEMQCYACHKMHSESPLTLGCYSCHHEQNYEKCSSCH